MNELVGARTAAAADSAIAGLTGGIGSMVQKLRHSALLLLAELEVPFLHCHLPFFMSRVSAFQYNFICLSPGPHLAFHCCQYLIHMLFPECHYHAWPSSVLGPSVFSIVHCRSNTVT